MSSAVAAYILPQGIDLPEKGAPLPLQEAAPDSLWQTLRQEETLSLPRNGWPDPTATPPALAECASQLPNVPEKYRADSEIG